MFCPSSNDKFLTLTEKTKLLAQKCTNQIQVIASGGQHQQHPHSHGMGIGSRGDGTQKPSLNCLGGLCLGPAGHSSSSSKGSVPRTTKWYVKVIQKTEQRIHSFKTHVRNHNLSELKFGLLLFKCQQEVGSVIFQWETIFEQRNDEIETGMV